MSTASYLESVREMIPRLEPAPDYASPMVMRAPMRSVWSAIAEGVGAIAAPFDGLSDVTWLASPWRDQFALAQDFWTAIEHPEVRVIYALVHPDQERLFDPSDVGA